MARIPRGLVLSEEEVYQEIDLKKWTGADLSDDPSLVRAIGQAVIDYVVERSANNKGLGNETLKPSKYTKTYASSLDFEAAGKSIGDVNMRLSGDMLDTIDIVDDGNRVKIEIDPSQAAKAYGHMTGFKGHPTIPEGKYKRQFFGITKEEFDKFIYPQFKSDINSSSGSKEDLQGQLIKRIRRASDLFGG